ncbi:MAG: hypothetical protein IJ037_11715, partial [Clostridia bacterium]|nr:hypothetical protein [Clostridia bacterium]
GIFHCSHNGKIGRDFVLLTVQEYIYHVFHCCSPSYDLSVINQFSSINSLNDITQSQTGCGEQGLGGPCELAQRFLMACTNKSLKHLNAQRLY